MDARKLFAVAISALLLAACAGPMDSPLVTGQGEAAYFARLNPLFAQMTPAQQEAFNWSVSDLSIDQLHQRYPDASPRQVIQGETRLVSTSYPERIAALQPQLEAFQHLQAELGQLRSDNVQFRIEQDFHGLQPRLKADFHNASSLSFSTSGWTALLYLNAADEPVARYSFTLNHRRRGGLLPGETESHDIHLGFVSGDPAWMTLEVRNASRRRVEIVPSDEGNTDLGERAYSAPDPRAEIERLQAVIAAAEKYRQVP